MNKSISDVVISVLGKHGYDARHVSNEMVSDFRDEMMNLFDKPQKSNVLLTVLNSGWRPAVGWCGAAGFAYEFSVRPILNGIFVAMGMPPVFPGIETEALISLVFGVLGLGSLRTAEKYKGVARN